MARNLLVAIWKIKFDVSANWPLNTKNQRLSTAVQSAYTHMKSSAQRMALEVPRYVFIAPEYYYIKDDKYALFDDQERDSIYQHVQNLTTAYPKLAIVPGTISYKVPPPGPVPGGLSGKNFAGYSAAPIYSDGSRIHLYEKKFNDRCIDRETDAKFVPGLHPQSFPLFGLAAGIEVCGDYGEENLSKEVQNLDFEILTSCTINHNFTNDQIHKIPVRDGGYIAQCDGTGVDHKNGVWQIRRGGGWHGSSGFSTQPGFKNDPQGMHPSTITPGNVSKVGELLPKLQDRDIRCYHCVI